MRAGRAAGLAVRLLLPLCVAGGLLLIFEKSLIYFPLRGHDATPGALGLPHEDAFAPQNKQSALLGFFPSEFSGLRLQYDHLTTAGKSPDDHTLALQYSVSIGAHPAHAY